MNNTTWVRLATLGAILGAAGLGLKYGRMQGKAIGEGDVDESFEVASPGAPCEPRGTLCIRPGNAQTVAGTQEGTAARLRRQGVADERASTDDTPWMLQIDGNLTHPALAGNALLIVADVADMQAGYMTVMRQGRVPGGTTFSARVRLSPKDGVLPGLSSTVGSEAWNSRDLKSRPH